MGSVFWSLVSQQLINFMCFYFDLWPSILSCLANMVIQYIGRIIFHEEEVNGHSLFTLIASMVMLAFLLWGMHLIMTKVGMIYVYAEILRQGNEQLLDNFDEGILIYAEETSDLIFANKAVKNLIQNNNLDDSINNISMSAMLDQDSTTLSKDDAVFAHVDPFVFKATPADFISVS